MPDPSSPCRVWCLQPVGVLSDILGSVAAAWGWGVLMGVSHEREQVQGLAGQVQPFSAAIKGHSPAPQWIFSGAGAQFTFALYHHPNSASLNCGADGGVKLLLSCPPGCQLLTAKTDGACTLTQSKIVVQSGGGNGSRIPVFLPHSTDSVEAVLGGRPSVGPSHGTGRAVVGRALVTGHIDTSGL